MRFHTFGDWSIKFTANLRAQEFADQYLLKHEFVKRLRARYAAEGIQIPFPAVRVLPEEEALAAELARLRDDARR